jgi:5-methyltetrahydrofolate--homocysteine methyltransferase
MDSALQPIYDNVLEGSMPGVKTTVQAALDAGVKAEVILQQALIPAMGEVGRRFEEGDYFVPEMLISARAMQAGLGLLKPLLVQDSVASAGKVVIGTVQGDLHDIGKNLVGMMLEGAGFEIIDLGTDVSADKFIAAVKDHGANVVAMSALLTTTMPRMQTTIQAFQAAGLREQVKIIVGGAPVTADYARSIGADGFAPDASRAAALARSLS